MSLMRKFSFFKCGSLSKRDRRHSKPLVKNRPGPVNGEEVSVECGSCQHGHLMSDSDNAFVCTNCCSVNRVSLLPLGDRGVSCVSDCPVILHRFGGDGFGSGEDFSVPQCSVCLDRCGDCLLVPCLHGGLCEDCAVHIAANLAVGGRHCPKCRTQIEEVVRVGQIGQEVLKGVSIELPVDVSQIEGSSVTVAPPVGLARAKELNPEYSRALTGSTDGGASQKDANESKLETTIGDTTMDTPEKTREDASYFRG